VVSKRDVQTFIEAIPDFHRLCQRLERIVLACRNSADDGVYEFYHREETGAIFLNAWPEDLWIDLNTWYFETHKETFLRLGVSHDRAEKTVLCRFTEAQARAFTLLHVFMHELGHHYDGCTKNIATLHVVKNTLSDLPTAALNTYIRCTSASSATQKMPANKIKLLHPS
jgi:hypothetical protein